MNKVVGYTSGVFDLFHIGHLNILKKARTMCDELIVGVTTDELVQKLKGKSPVIPFEERLEIVRSIRYVDTAIPELVDDKIAAWDALQFNVIFKGDDWKGTQKWLVLEEKFKELDVSVIFFPYTAGTSSSLVQQALQ